MLYILCAFLIVWLICLRIAQNRLDKHVAAVMLEARAIEWAALGVYAARDAWKAYALAIETWDECSEEVVDCSDDALEQCINARQAVRVAAQQLCDLGEYPDIFELSPYLA